MCFDRTNTSLEESVSYRDPYPQRDDGHARRCMKEVWYLLKLSYELMLGIIRQNVFTLISSVRSPADTGLQVCAKIIDTDLTVLLTKALRPK